MRITKMSILYNTINSMYTSGVGNRFFGHDFNPSRPPRSRVGSTPIIHLVGVILLRKAHYARASVEDARYPMIAGGADSEKSL